MGTENISFEGDKNGQWRENRSMKRFVALSISLVLFVEPYSYAAGSIKFNNQKAGQFCKKTDLAKTVTLPNKSILKCTLVGNKYFWKILKAAPLEAPLIPSFGSTVSKVNGTYSVEITNYDENFLWLVDSEDATAWITPDGLVNFSPAINSGLLYINVSTVRDGYVSGKGVLKLNVTPAAPTPSLPNIEFDSSSYIQNDTTAEITIKNFDKDSTYSVSTLTGKATIDSNGKISISGLTPELSVITVTQSKTGFLSTTGTYSVSGKPNFKSITERDWQFILKNPNDYFNQYFIVYGKITQFDTATGNDSFRANVSGIDQYSKGYWLGGDNTLLVGNAALLKPFVNNDIFVAKVSVLGTFSYTSVFNGNLTVPKLKVFEITRIHG